LGVLRDLPAGKVSVARRRRVITSTKGTGPILDQLLTGERDRV
jgi:hypothetical protein